ncbi:hypothetical protein DIZ76_015749 [Coccidioides immitis]|uniref:Uncharacterized protein n=2 Tax=Coccidioides immitis TaxID=5501 RepID=A0A0J8QSH3_COCIT|nr:hypothetical protein CIRG_05146 [Coccidioides immitis RMSCC 2394]KMU74193.1 hypothetical protein CISG_10293 [Coccidioides immitis RMSCC 3703]TPX21786.1 hypothetical protein DIZ76_015749 [Coccidioides immitis]
MAVQLNGTPSIELASNPDDCPSKLDEIAWLVTVLKGTIAQQGQDSGSPKNPDTAQTGTANVGINCLCQQNKQPAPNPSTGISAAPTSDPIDNEESLARYLPAEEVKAWVTNALQKNTPTEGVKVIGVGTTKTGYIIRFQDETSKDAASKDDG